MLLKLLCKIYRLLLSVRYRLEISWLDNLKHDWPLLILPNHQALVDPQILIVNLAEFIVVSPVIIESYYNLPIIKWIFKFMNAIPMWDLTTWSDKKSVEQAFQDVVKALQQWRNILIYPSGQLYSQWFESIIWKQSVFNIVNMMPNNVKIIWVRLTWLRWSMWSKAWIWKNPNLVRTLFKSVRYVIVNLVFFIPKRRVVMEIEDLTKQIKSLDDLGEQNKYLEKFYNKYWEEEIFYLKHYFFYDDIQGKTKPTIIKWSLKQLQQTKTFDINDFPVEVFEKISKKIIQMKWLNMSSKDDLIKLESRLIFDLYFDSLDVAEIKSYVQTNFRWSSNPPILDIRTIGDLCLMAVWKSTTVEELKLCNWDQIAENTNIQLKQILKTNFDKLWDNANILTMFKSVFKSEKTNDFIFDNLLWKQSKNEFLVKAYLISDYIRNFDWKYVGIMIPATSFTSIIIIATYLAGKIPVMLNWTLWSDALDHCIKFANLNFIFTSHSFYDRVKNDSLDKHFDKYVYMEDILNKIPVIKKLKALVKSLFFILPDCSDQAVLLYTSWSESLPKAVSLTHKNIISNLIWSMEIFDLKSDNILLWFLPPFHSFGFTVNTMLPLMTGMRVVYTPDPNDAKTIVELIKHCKITVISSTPTFLKFIMNMASSDDMLSVKIVVVWAEKCSDDIFDKFDKLCPNWLILEWYGITECSPVVSINPIKNIKRWSVWVPIWWSDLKILDLGNGNECWSWEQGMIYVSGHSIFWWYLDRNLDSPFYEIDISWKQIRYYKTWDIWYLDQDGFLYITGRLKRFIKIAWEMISLPFVEWILSKKYSTDDEYKIAVESIEIEWDARIILFSVDKIDIDEANKYLRSCWVSNLIKISEVRKIEKIPLLGTGKIDYKVLKSMI